MLEDVSAMFQHLLRLARHITGQLLVIAGGMEGRQIWRPAEVNVTVV
jgi:hypothetical protein